MSKTIRYAYEATKADEHARRRRTVRAIRHEERGLDDELDVRGGHDASRALAARDARRDGRWAR